MTRNAELLDRMYGRPPGPPATPPRRRVGIVPALWLAAIVLAGAAGLTVAALSGGAIVTGAADNELVQWGVLDRDEKVMAYAEGDGPQTGCALVTTGYLVRWADQAPVGRVDVRGGTLEAKGGTVVGGSTTSTLSCDVGDQAEHFVAQAAPFLQQRHPIEHPGRDPRVDGFRRAR